MTHSVLLAACREVTLGSGELLSECALGIFNEFEWRHGSCALTNRSKAFLLVKSSKRLAGASHRCVHRCCSQCQCHIFGFYSPSLPFSVRNQLSRSQLHNVCALILQGTAVTSPGLDTTPTTPADKNPQDIFFHVSECKFDAEAISSLVRSHSTPDV